MASARDLDQGAVGDRNTHRLALSTVAVLREETTIQTGGLDPMETVTDIPSLKANGATTRSPCLTFVT